MMHNHFLFPTPLLVAELFDEPGPIDDLRDTILGRHDQDPGVRHSNEGGWQSAQDFYTWCGDVGHHVLTSAARIGTDNTLVFGENGVRRCDFDWQIAAWANVSWRGSQNASHVHPGSFWSGCFYVDDGGIAGEDRLGGAIEFQDPRGPAPIMHAPNLKFGIKGCVSAGLGERVYPKTGQLLMFPAWLSHSVTRYDGDGTRISIAFNLSL